MMRAMAHSPREARPEARDFPPRPDAEAGSISCGRCRRIYTLQAWRALTKVRTLSADEVHRHLKDWRDERVIEVRACVACGRAMARMVALSR